MRNHSFSRRSAALLLPAAMLMAIHAGASEITVELNDSTLDAGVKQCLESQRIRLESPSDLNAVADSCGITRDELSNHLIQAILPELRGMAYGLQLVTGKTVLEISENGYQDPELGVVTHTYGTDGGLQISAVTPGSAAEVAGLRARDIILSINGVAFNDINDRVARRRLGEMIEELGVDAEMDIEFRRSGEVMWTVATIGSRSFPPFTFIVGD